MAARITPASLATAANVNRVWVKKAIDLGLISPHSLDGEDVIVVQVLAIVDQLVWPGGRRSRSVSREMEVGQSLVVNTAREAIGDSRTSRETLLWIMQDGVEVTYTAGERAAFVIDGLNNRCAYTVPIGEWVATLPEGFQVPASHRLAAASSSSAAA